MSGRAAAANAWACCPQSRRVSHEAWIAACSIAATARSSSSGSLALTATNPVAAQHAVAGGEVGLLLEDVLVLRRLLGVLDLADLLALGGIGDVLGLLLADVARGAVGAHRRVEQCEGPPNAGGEKQGREEAGVHEGSRPLADPEHAVVRGVAAQGAPRSR